MNVLSESLEFKIRCHFCGKLNHFKKEELYLSEKNGEILKLKYCLDCGEPLVFQCPICKIRFRIDYNFQKNNMLNLLPSYWEPKQSIIDTLIPSLHQMKKKYEELAKNLSKESFRRSQKDFLNLLPKAFENIQSIYDCIVKLPETNNIDIKSSQDNVLKIIEKIIEEIEEIQNDIDPKLELVSEKKEKQIKKKGLHFSDILNPLDSFIITLNEFRKSEIEKEKDSLKPGYQKIKDNIQYDPQFFQLICPSCNTKIYNIKHKIYTLNNKNILQLKEEIPLSNSSRDESVLSKTVHFQIKIHIHKSQEHHLHGQFALVLHEGNQVTFGRDFIREIEYEEEISDILLFSEDDPLARVSNSQLTLEKQGNHTILKPMKYDPRRIGTYLNSLENDLRKQHPEGIALKESDYIIIPLIGEKNNPNRIEINLISL